MKLTEVLTLINAGYTKAEIEALASPVFTDAVEVTAEVTETTAPVEVTAEPLTKEPEVKQDPVPDTAELMQQINELKALVRMNAVRNTVQPSVSVPSVGDALTNMMKGVR